MSTPDRRSPARGEQRLRTLVIRARDQSGVLNRVTSLMRARSFNIDSLTASHTDQAGISHMTVTLHGDEGTVEQAAKQLYRLIDVLRVDDLSDVPAVSHELALVRVRATGERRAELVRIVAMHRARVVDLAADSLIVETSGTEAEVDALVALLRCFGIRDLVRTGAIAMARGRTTSGR